MKAEKKKPKFSHEFLDELIRGGGTSEGLLGSGGLLHELKGALMERMLQGELTAHLGYEKHERSPTSGNSRNGGTSKKIHTESGPVEVEIGRASCRERV